MLDFSTKILRGVWQLTYVNSLMVIPAEIDIGPMINARQRFGLHVHSSRFTSGKGVFKVQSC